uniref:Uncharacterized protein n=1 Tax=Glycine max TaxID=3847 RepID=C6T0M1_SOYBN|nr:unknown [Glycine max]
MRLLTKSRKKQRAALIANPLVWDVEEEEVGRMVLVDVNQKELGVALMKVDLKDKEDEVGVVPVESLVETEVEGEVEVDLGTDMELQMGQLLLLKALVPVQNSYYLCYVSCVLLILGFQLFSCIYSHKNGVYYGPHQSFYANIVFRCLLS